MTPYQKHRKRWNKCTKCELCGQRSKVVLTRGSVPANIVFVGEAPGLSEDVVGRPFVGPAGKLMDYIIGQSIGDRFRYCLTNLVACFPREAKEAGNNEPPKEAIEACAPRLNEFVRLCKPRLVVLVGKLAAKYVYGQAQFDPPWIPPAELRFVQILHPAAILRMDKAQQGLAVHRSVLTIADGVDGIAR